MADTQADPLYLDAIEAFLKDLSKDLAISRGYVSAKTLGSYRHRLTELGRFAARKRRTLQGSPEDQGKDADAVAALRLSDFSEDLLKDYLIDHLTAGNAPTTLNTHLYTLKPFWHFAAKRYRAADLTADLQRSRAQRTRGAHLPERHVEAFLAHMADRQDVTARIRLRDAVFFQVIARYGTRISEALGLDLESLTVTPHSVDLRVVGKGNKPRVVPLPLFDEKGRIEGRQAFVDLLQEYLKARKRWKAAPGHEKALFLSQKGMRWSDDAARAVFQSAMQALGFRQFGYVVHSLRHSVASRLLNAGVGLPTVSRILGHASTQVTASIYAHSDLDEVEKGMTKTF